MLNVCTICKAEFEDDDSHELTDNDICPDCFDGIYREMLEKGEEPIIFDTLEPMSFNPDIGKVDFTFEDLD